MSRRAASRRPQCGDDGDSRNDSHDGAVSVLIQEIGAEDAGGESSDDLN